MIGKTLAHYKITGLLGKGGMGEVYRATDAKLGREVAVKVLPQAFTEDRERLARFDQEARTLASLNHPGIVTIHSVEEAEGLHFLTMELVAGEDLSRRIPRGGMPLGRIFDFAIPLAEAVAAAHDQRVLHRDLKPGNIMVSEEGRIKVLDFGLAKLRLEQDRLELTQAATEPMTGEGRILGTVPYMSPEQLEGRELDARSDIFSLGVILYEMATGERPFRGDNSASLVSSILKDVPLEVDSLRGDLPRHLGRIIRRCLEKERRQRYQSALDVYNELVDLRRETDSADAAGSGPGASVRPPRRRMPVRLAAGVAGILALVLLGYGLWRGGVRSPQEPMEATAPTVAERPMLVVLPFENLGAPEEEYFAAGITDEITARLARLQGLGVIARTSAVQYATTQQDIQEIAQELGVDFLLAGTVRWAHDPLGASRVRVTPQLIAASDATQLWADAYEGNLADIFEVQSDIAEQVARALNITLIEKDRQRLADRLTDDLEAYDYYLRGTDHARRYGVKREMLEAVEMFQRAVEADPRFAQAYARLAMAHGTLSRGFDRSRERLNAAKEALDRAAELGPNQPEVHLALGDHYLRRAPPDLDRALLEFSTALELEPSSADAQRGVGLTRRAQGEVDDALDHLERAAELDPRGYTRFWDIGETYMRWRNYPEAERYFDRALFLVPDWPLPRSRKLFLYLAWGNLDEARAVAGEAVDKLGLTQFLGEANPWGHNWLMVLKALGEEHYEGVASIPLDDWPRETYSYYLGQAAVHQLMDRPPEARRFYDQARTSLEAEIAAQPEDSLLHALLGVAHVALGHTELAIQEGERAVALNPLRGSELEGGFRLQALAYIYFLSGDSENGLRRLDEVLSQPSWVSVGALRIHPGFDSFRNDRGFQELLEKHGKADSKIR